VVYAPQISADVVEGTLNLWRGFSVKADASKSCTLYLAHLRDNVCVNADGTPNADYYDYLIKWMARAVQFPGMPGEVAVALRGKEGVGKGIFAKWFGRLFGSHFFLVTHPDHLFHKFNSHLEQCSVLHGDECFFAGNPQHDAMLKTLITEPTLMIEHKGMPSYQARNNLSIILTTKSKWLVPASQDARRYFVLDVASHKMQDSTYFTAIETEMREGGLSGLLAHLRSIDIADFDVRKMPQTEALRAQKDETRAHRDPLKDWWLTLLHSGQLPSGVVRGECCHAPCHDREWIDKKGQRRRVEGLYEDAKRRVPRLGKFDTSDRAFGDFLNTQGVLRKEYAGRDGRLFPPLGELRAAWAAEHGPVAWDNPTGHWEDGNQEVDNETIPF
jgi:hypothetical protein